MKNGTAASTSNQWIRWVGGRELLRMAVLAMGLALIAGYVSYMSLRIRVTYTLQTRVALLEAERMESAAANAAFHEGISERLDNLERIIFGEVLTKIDVPPPKPSVVQLWQRNRDLQIRKRLEALEQWRAQTEGRGRGEGKK